MASNPHTHPREFSPVRAGLRASDAPHRDAQKAGAQLPSCGVDLFFAAGSVARRQSRRVAQRQTRQAALSVCKAQKACKPFAILPHIRSEFSGPGGMCNCDLDRSKSRPILHLPASLLSAVRPSFLVSQP